MRKSFLFIFLIFLVNSIFSYSSTNNSTDEEIKKVFDKNKKIIVVYRASIKDNIPKKYIENIKEIESLVNRVYLKEVPSKADMSVKDIVSAFNK